MYDTFYNLKKKPFQLNPDPTFFFNSAVHKRALAYLRYGLAQGEGFIVVTGAPGTGKTMLVKELFENIRGEEVVAGLMVTSQVGAEDTLRIIAATFGLSYDGDAKAVLLKNLENFFKLKAREGKRVLLVVDEAQNLPYQSMEELRMLLNFELDGRAIFQVFMLGQDELRLMLQSDNMEQVRQRITATYHLRPLDVEESREYIEHRLLTAGWENDPKFLDEVYEEVHRYTGGVPRRINTVCDRLLLYGFLEEIHEINHDAVALVIHEIEQDSVKQQNAPEVRIEHSSGYSHVSPRADTSYAPPIEGSLEDRLAYLENTVSAMRRGMQKERALLRKAILIQLDLDEIYDDASFDASQQS
ncbi:XrtA/PEP-CTERM system-associated ATPase [Methylococcus sp. EFPC2]|uniref:XrtA/PEP-CTERM system-associated ATPase n=1 Tax=Methylococcus sp. EFPC2 TaxID=2812648 RepID=UPI001967D145|nr:XrtA/PEP-CTERM system-associated ATPase [Methylococcus sp. EFPC2]QSA98015.1 AAA family ATPase [Methylococcus sp. EFPC2]